MGLEPLVAEPFWNRTGREICLGEILRVRPDDTSAVELVRPTEAHALFALGDLGVLVRALEGGAPPDTAVLCEVCLPHALTWAAARRR